MAEINHLIGIKGSLGAVYAAIGTVEGLKEWWTADASGSSEVGETIHFRFGKIGAQDMKVTELRKDTLVDGPAPNTNPLSGLALNLPSNSRRPMVRSIYVSRNPNGKK